MARTAEQAIDVLRFYATHTGPVYAAARVSRIEDMRQLQAASDHANRLDYKGQARQRHDGDARQTLRYHPYKLNRRKKKELAYDYVADFKLMKSKRLVVERKGTAPVTHILFVISPHWISSTGGVHDPRNPRNRAVFKTAIQWAHAIFGKDALLAARMDMDELGGGLVDLFVCPTMTSKKGKQVLSVSPRLKALQEQYDRDLSFKAVQDSVAEYAQQHLDRQIERGKEKEGRRRDDYLTPDNFAAQQANERERERLEELAEDLRGQREKLEQDKKAAAALNEEAAATAERIMKEAAEAGRREAERLLEAAETEAAELKRQANDQLNQASQVKAAAQAAAETERTHVRAAGLEEGRAEARKEASERHEALRRVLDGVADGSIISVDTSGRLRFTRTPTRSEADFKADYAKVQPFATVVAQVAYTRQEIVLKEYEKGLARAKATEEVAKAVHAGTLIDYEAQLDKWDFAEGTDPAERNAIAVALQQGSPFAKQIAVTAIEAKKSGFREGLRRGAQRAMEGFRVGVRALLEGKLYFRRAEEPNNKPDLIVETSDQAENDAIKKAIIPTLSEGLQDLLIRLQASIVQLGISKEIRRRAARKLGDL